MVCQPSSRDRRSSAGQPAELGYRNGPSRQARLGQAVLQLAALAARSPQLLGSSCRPPGASPNRPHFPGHPPRPGAARQRCQTCVPRTSRWPSRAGCRAASQRSGQRPAGHGLRHRSLGAQRAQVRANLRATRRRQSCGNDEAAFSGRETPLRLEAAGTRAAHPSGRRPSNFARRDSSH
jgi:hypothetical protein